MSDEIMISRKNAETSGLSFFFTGTPCVHGHLSRRSVSNGKCCECVQIRNKAASKTISPEENRARYLHGREAVLEARKALRRARGLLKPGPKPHVSAETKAILRRAWLSENKEIHTEYQKKYYLDRRAIKLASAKQYREGHPDICRAAKRITEARRQERVRQAPGSYDQSNIAAIRLSQEGRCAECQCSLGTRPHTDHIMPIARGGSNFPSNIQLLCKSCSDSKGAKSPTEWATWKRELAARGLR